MKTWSIGHGVTLSYYPTLFLKDDADQLLEAVSQHEADLKQRPVVVMGRTIPQPRLTAWHAPAGHTYRYSGVTLKPAPFTPALSRIRDYVNDAVTDGDFNCVLVNLYRTGADYIGFHQDKEKEFGGDPMVASVSLGAARRFVIESLASPKRREEIVLEHGSLLVMGRGMQRLFRHSLPKAPRVKEPRVNLTFRRHLGVGG
jgi:alkylated DNA repair dioxygenase AlkB